MEFTSTLSALLVCILLSAAIYYINKLHVMEGKVEDLFNSWKNMTGFIEDVNKYLLQVEQLQSGLLKVTKEFEDIVTKQSSLEEETRRIESMTREDRKETHFLQQLLEQMEQNVSEITFSLEACTVESSRAFQVAQVDSQKLINLEASVEDCKQELSMVKKDLSRLHTVTEESIKIKDSGPDTVLKLTLEVSRLRDEVHQLKMGVLWDTNIPETILESSDKKGASSGGTEEENTLENDVPTEDDNCSVISRSNSSVFHSESRSLLRLYEQISELKAQHAELAARVASIMFHLKGHKDFLGLHSREYKSGYLPRPPRQSFDIVSSISAFRGWKHNPNENECL